jgi:hypothetical protein
MIKIVKSDSFANRTTGRIKYNPEKFVEQLAFSELRKGLGPSVEILI